MQRLEQFLLFGEKETRTVRVFRFISVMRNRCIERLFVLLFAFGMPLCVDRWTFGRAVLMGGMDFMCFCLLVSVWLPPRRGFLALRVLAGSVFLAYATYLVYELFFSGKPFTITGRRSDASSFNALCGFVFIGGPSLLLAVFGIHSFRRTSESGSDDDDT